MPINIMTSLTSRSFAAAALPYKGLSAESGVTVARRHPMELPIGVATFLGDLLVFRPVRWSSTATTSSVMPCGSLGEPQVRVGDRREWAEPLS